MDYSLLRSPDRENGESDLLQHSKEPEQREQEQIRSTSTLQKEGVYIPTPYSELVDPIFNPSPDIPDYYEVDTGAESMKEYERTKNHGLTKRG